MGLPGISKQATKESLLCLSGEHKGLACPARWHPAIQNAASQKGLLVFTIYRSSLACSSSHRELITHRKVEADSGWTRTSLPDEAQSPQRERWGGWTVSADCLPRRQKILPAHFCRSASQLLAFLATY